MSASSTQCDGDTLTGLSTRSVLLRHFNTTTLALSLFVGWALVSAGGKRLRLECRVNRSCDEFKDSKSAQDYWE